MSSDPEIVRSYTQQLTLMGRVVGIVVEPDEPPGLVVRLRSGDQVKARLMPTSWFNTLKNLDLLDRD